MLKVMGCWLVFCVYFVLGDWLANTINLPVSGAVCGLLLLFLSLLLSRRLVSWISQPSQPILANMTFFFIPAVLGMLAFTSLIFEHWLALFIALFLTTIISLAACATLTQRFINQRESKRHE